MKRAALLLLCASTAILAQPATQLWSRGYSVIPTPRQVTLEDGEVVLDSSWSVDAAALDWNHIAVRALLAGLNELHGLGPRPGLARFQTADDSTGAKDKGSSTARA